MAGELGVNLTDIGRYYASLPDGFFLAAAITMLPPRADAGAPWQRSKRSGLVRTSMRNFLFDN